MGLPILTPIQQSVMPARCAETQVFLNSRIDHETFHDCAREPISSEPGFPRTLSRISIVNPIAPTPTPTGIFMDNQAVLIPDSTRPSHLFVASLVVSSRSSEGGTVVQRQIKATRVAIGNAARPTLATSNSHLEHHSRLPLQRARHDFGVQQKRGQPGRLTACFPVGIPADIKPATPDSLTALVAPRTSAVLPAHSEARAARLRADADDRMHARYFLAEVSPPCITPSRLPLSTAPIHPRPLPPKKRTCNARKSCRSVRSRTRAMESRAIIILTL
ncbi:hypothetical protein HETIRDRAFT_106576 [Heterobasidion irregulare TC 32-1]|uniref:Uncharacterized protein n=1 Tax=Heterobasidion irregulare (strain TC 32-1) TaxID=747525 RepID=W4JSU5_HETIT|nr:uncharacterized protein HETIRDRAFT_106576 [Heterobasidion irregulare TC 32-1]ETW75936.1 hypothetical protein HETIRDRAFT_106576 [Heterobasidion irregulare TC 32-1]